MALSNRDPKTMSKEEIQAELDDINEKYMSSGKEFVEGIAKTVHGVTAPMETAMNVADYFSPFMGAPVRAAIIEGVREYKKPESTSGDVAAAALSGPIKSMLRDPTEYDPRYNFATLAKEIGVTEEPIPGTKIPVNKAVGFGAEMVADPMNLLFRTPKLVGTAMKESSLAAAEHGLTGMSDAGVRKTSEWLNKDKIKSVANTMRETDLMKYITRPEKLYKKLHGDTSLAEHPEFPGKMIQKNKGNGLLDKIGQERDRAVKEIKASTNPLLNKRDTIRLIADDIIQKNRSLQGGSLYRPEEDKKIFEKVKGLFKYGVGTDDMDIEELVKLKTTLQKKVYETGRAFANGADVGTDKAIYETAEEAITDYLNHLASGPNVPKEAGLAFLKHNQTYSDLSVLSDIVENAKYNKYKESSGLMGDVIAPLVGGGIGALAGVDPVIAAGAYTIAKKTGSAMRGQTPSAMARVMGATIPGLPPVTTERMLNYVQKPAAATRGILGNQEEPSRSPQSVNLPMQLVSYQIPRDSNAILQNKEVVKMKIAQMSNNPQMVAMISDALDNHPEKLNKMLPAIVLQFPDLFEDDDYNRVDGKIFDPVMKEKALKDISNNTTMDIRTKAFKAKRLHAENILE